jgi:hypothetical protein
MGQSEFFRIQLMHASSREIMTLPSTLESYAAGAVIAMREAYDSGGLRQGDSAERRKNAEVRTQRSAGS